MVGGRCSRESHVSNERTRVLFFALPAQQELFRGTLSCSLFTWELGYSVDPFCVDTLPSPMLISRSNQAESHGHWRIPLNILLAAR